MIIDTDGISPFLFPKEKFYVDIDFFILSTSFDNFESRSFFRRNDECFISVDQNSYVSHRRLRRSGLRSYIIDKTRIIQYLDICGFNFFSAPKRFGKTFTATMICAYYDLHYGSVYDELFGDTYIYMAQNCSKVLRNSFLVYEVTFSEILYHSMDIYLSSMFQCLMNGFYKFSEKYFGSNKSQDFLNHLSSIFGSIELKILGFISELINFCDTYFQSNGENYKYLVFFDEIQDAYAPLLIDSKDGYDSRIVFFSKFLGSITKGYSVGQYKLSLLMTGLLPLPSCIASSKLEIIHNHSLFSPLMSLYIGFFEKDVIKLFNDFGISEIGKAIIRKGLNSYRFCDFESLSAFFPECQESDLALYNPWSLINSIKNGRLTYSFIPGNIPVLVLDKVISNPDKQCIDIMAGLLTCQTYIIGEWVMSDYIELEMITKVVSKDNFLFLLLLSGFLCYNKPEVYIPNEEIQSFFVTKFSIYLTNNGIPVNPSLLSLGDLKSENIKLFFSELQEEIMKSAKQHLQYNEIFYWSILFIWLRNTFGQGFVSISHPISHKSAFSMSPTYADLVIITKEGLCVLLELRLSGKNLNEMKKSAFNGYSRLFKSQYCDIYHQNQIQMFILSSLSFCENNTFIIFSKPIPKSFFQENIDYTSFEYSIIEPESTKASPRKFFYESSVSSKLSFINADLNDVNEIITQKKRGSSVILINNMKEIESIKSLIKWPIIKGKNTQKERETIFHDFLGKNPYIICTFASIRGLVIEKVDTVFLMSLPKEIITLKNVYDLVQYELIVFYQNNEIKKKSNIEKSWNECIEATKNRNIPDIWNLKNM